MKSTYTLEYCMPYILKVCRLNINICCNQTHKCNKQKTGPINQSIICKHALLCNEWTPGWTQLIDAIGGNFPYKLYLYLLCTGSTLLTVVGY